MTRDVEVQIPLSEAHEASNSKFVVGSDQSVVVKWFYHRL